ncbi:Serine/threonine-protein phosphatase 2A activator 1 [Neolecta irregularis DAH-3]|uniref:Serine/threonine-protein phosphatase 2A activator n=1 Tax=Neolecta irregularis (strain DAH-3) TaxID=1198029 RepID=A0A1U7LT35_NEOID|nr:Serine/threonine-protein phosphatase 2A activator 1 [Neolecta irregularis DAH-3]|eukprot:OLL25836.1 Serine/threonine-protein phosphatase 2A activator 1 [Neolecta irregularis DAH-3]
MLQILTPGSDDLAVALRVFEKYFQLIRNILRTYTLEPAGSHGVWGLDDHSFIPYLFGSSQLRQQSSSVSPADITNAKIVERERHNNLYFGAIGFINDVKRGPFYEHSPILYDISGIPNWDKINQGLNKMYNAEVLSKFPVVQHFPFGPSLFPFQILEPSKKLPPPTFSEAMSQSHSTKE